MDLTPPNIHSLEDVNVYLERMYEYLKWIGNFQCQYMEWQEVTTPERPEAGRARMYAVESDDGRTQLVAIFDTGSAIRMVIEQQTTDDIDEGSSNLFFTNARVASVIPDTDSMDEGSTNLYYTDARVSSRITNDLPDTDSLTEGSTNLYYTNERVDDRVDTLVTDGDGITTTYDDGAGTLTFAVKQQTHVVDASASHTITDPADAPATADALRDDLVLNTIPDIEAALDALGAKINAILVQLETAEILASA